MYFSDEENKALPHPLPHPPGLEQVVLMIEASTLQHTVTLCHLTKCSQLLLLQTICTHMCTTYSECVADVYVGVKTHLRNIHTRPCTSAHNTCKVHVTLTAKKMHIYIYLHTYAYAYICTRKHMRMHDTIHTLKH